MSDLVSSMRREGRVRGKPTNTSRSGGSIYSLLPVEESKHKSKGRYKRFAADMITNPRFAEFLIKPKELPDFSEYLFDIANDLVDLEPDERLLESCEADEDAVQLGILVVTVNSLIEAAFAKMHGDDWQKDESTALACTFEDFQLEERGHGARKAGRILNSQRRSRKTW